MKQLKLTFNNMNDVMVVIMISNFRNECILVLDLIYVTLGLVQFPAFLIRTHSRKYKTMFVAQNIKQNTQVGERSACSELPADRRGIPNSAFHRMTHSKVNSEK